MCTCMGKCRARIQSMGHHTWLYVTFIYITAILNYDVWSLLLFCRADQFDYVMYGKVYRIEGDETSTEAATRL